MHIIIVIGQGAKMCRVWKKRALLGRLLSRVEGTARRSASGQGGAFGPSLFRVRLVGGWTQGAVHDLAGLPTQERERGLQVPRCVTGWLGCRPAALKCARRRCHAQVD